jgi:hypothetical protein
MMIVPLLVEIAESVTDGLVGGSVLASVLLAGWALGPRRAQVLQPVRIRAGRS